MGSVRTPCINHPRRYAANATGKCPECIQGSNQRRNSRRANAPGNGAALKIRKVLRAFPDELYRCRQCTKSYRPSTIEVDHIKPLADGGLDVETNIQLLCKPCHKAKTSAENSARK